MQQNSGPFIDSNQLSREIVSALAFAKDRFFTYALLDLGQRITVANVVN